MPDLPDVISGDPHVAAHNDERRAINDLLGKVLPDGVVATPHGIRNIPLDPESGEPVGPGFWMTDGVDGPAGFHLVSGNMGPNGPEGEYAMLNISLSGITLSGAAEDGKNYMMHLTPGDITIYQQTTNDDERGRYVSLNAEGLAVYRGEEVTFQGLFTDAQGPLSVGGQGSLNGDRTQFEDINSVVNTSKMKVDGAIGFMTGEGKITPVFAMGPGAGTGWALGDGTVITPA